MDVIWILAGLGGLGGIGFVALMILAPAAAAVVGQFAAALLNTRAGLVVVAAAGGLFAGDVYRASVDHNAVKTAVAANDTKWIGKINDASARFKVARVTRDADVTTAIDVIVDKATQEIDAHARALQQKVDAYEKGNAHPGCVLSPADLDGLPDRPGAGAATRHR